MVWRLRTVSLTTAALTLSGCAAMQRTWDFEATDVSGPPIQVHATEAHVTQKDVWLTLEVSNISEQPLDVTFETFVLTLPDGEEVLGYVSYLDRSMGNLKNTFNSVRGKDTSSPPLGPGQMLEVQLNFHQYGRDLRRLPSLSVDMGGLLVDGASTPLPTMRLQAPPEAPIGEHI